jgi:hypothetical protein
VPPAESALIRALRRSRRGSRASASRVASIWPAAVSDPALPVRSTMAGGSPFPPAPWSAQAVTGWKPQVFFQAGEACSFSECAITMVASRSTVTTPSLPGAFPPARFQARSRAAARAARIAFSACGASSASALTSRDTTRSDATPADATLAEIEAFGRQLAYDARIFLAARLRDLAMTDALLSEGGPTGPWCAYGIGQTHVREADLAGVTVASTFPVLPQVGTETEYRPPGRRKVATPALSVVAFTLVSLAVTLTSAFTTDCVRVPCGPPA